jgi:hypothetical protein
MSIFPLDFAAIEKYTLISPGSLSGGNLWRTNRKCVVKLQSKKGANAMNERTTTKVKVSLSKTVFLVTAILIIFSSSAVAQQSLRDIATEFGCEWLAGRWTTTTNEGAVIQLTYKWELNGHLMTVDFKMGEYASRGMIFKVQSEEEATQVSVDNRGGRSKATWEAREDGSLVSKSERVNAEGEVQKSAAVYSKVDAKTIKIALYGLNEDGELNDEPWFTTEFKRQADKKKGKPAAEQQKKST